MCDCATCGLYYACENPGCTNDCCPACEAADEAYQARLDLDALGDEPLDDDAYHTCFDEE